MEPIDNVTMGFPKRLYEGGNEPPPGKSTNYRSKLELMPRLQTFLGHELWEEVKKSPLGVVVKFYEQNFVWSSRIVHQLLTRQLATEKKYELWFVISGVPLRFTLREYEEVTGLNCVPLVEEESGDIMEIGLFGKLEIQKNRVIPSVNELMIGFETNVIQSRMDKLRAAYLIIVASVIMGCDRRTSIPKHLVRLVNYVDRFVAYPWGRVGFKALVNDVKTRDFNQHSYVIGGFAQVLQVWAYSLFPNVGDGVWCKQRNDGPTLLRYKGSKTKVLLENLGEVDMSGLEAGNVEWEDEVEDIQTDNILKYYEEHKSFEGVTWLPLAGTTIKVPTLRVKGEKRKVKEVEAENVGRAKISKTDGRDEAEGSGGSPKILTEAWGRRVESTLRNVEAMLKKLLGDGSGAENDFPSPKSAGPKKGTNGKSVRKTPRKASTPTPPSKPQKVPTPPKAPTPKRNVQPQKEKGVVVTRRSIRNQVLRLTN